MEKRITYTRREAAQAIGVSLPTLDAYMKRADNPLPCIRLSGGGKIIIPISGLMQWLEDESKRCGCSNMAK